MVSKSRLYNTDELGLDVRSDDIRTTDDYFGNERAVSAVQVLFLYGCVSMSTGLFAPGAIKEPSAGRLPLKQRVSLFESAFPPYCISSSQTVDPEPKRHTARVSLSNCTSLYRLVLISVQPQSQLAGVKNARSSSGRIRRQKSKDIRSAPDRISQ